MSWQRKRYDPPFDVGKECSSRRLPSGIYIRPDIQLNMAVDFNFESKWEIILEKNEDTGELEEQWTGDYNFENEWQIYRTKKDQSLELKSIFHKCVPGRRKISVKVVDIFGNDTMTIVDVSV